MPKRTHLVLWGRWCQRPQCNPMLKGFLADADNSAWPRPPPVAPAYPIAHKPDPTVDDRASPPAEAMMRLLLSYHG